MSSETHPNSFDNSQHNAKGEDKSNCQSEKLLDIDTNDTISEGALFKDDENQDRGNWSGKLDFLISLLGYSVGVGNIWRFPYLCYKNGGSVFLIPYLTTLFFVGLPIFYLETNLGQFSSCGPLTCWEFAPLFKGVGIGMVVISGLVTIYYNVLMAYAFFFLFASFTSYLPWSDCDNWWNSDTCTHKLPIITNCTLFNDTLDMNINGTCTNGTDVIGVWNNTIFTNETGLKRRSPSEEFWNHRVLQKSRGLEVIVGVQWEMFGLLILAWIVTFLCLAKGIKTTGKVVYFTALFPYVVLLTLFGNGLTLEGCGKGIDFYINPSGKWHKLLEAQVWKDGATQVFYSMGMCWGGLMAMSSYNKFHHNSLRDSLIVPVSAAATSILGGFVIFSYLGHMSFVMDVDMKSVATSGPGLAFVVYPEALLTLPVAPVWSSVFFFMLILIGLDSQFVTVETILTGVCDQFPRLRARKTYVVAAICAFEFVIGIPLVTKGGYYLFYLCDSFMGISLPLLCVAETFAITCVYGVRRFQKDIEIMTGRNICLPFMTVSWTILAPVVVFAVLVSSLVDYKRLTLDDYEYPVYAEVLGWFVAVTPFGAMILSMALTLLLTHTETKNILERLKRLCKPTKFWGPYNVEHRMLVDYVPGFLVDVRGECENGTDELKILTTNGQSTKNKTLSPL